MASRCGRELSFCFVVLTVFLCGAGGVRAGPAVGQFELKDLEAEPGRIEFQSQNAHSFGQPRRKVARENDGGLLYDDNTVVRQRHALELEATLSHFLRMRVGIEFEKERIEEPDTFARGEAFNALKLDEVAVEGVVIFVPVKNRRGIGLGALVEVEKPLEKGELSSIVFGPIVEVQSGRWSAVANLLLVHFFGRGAVTEDGLERDDKWDFAYAGQVMFEVGDNWSVALEAYGTVDRIGNSGMAGSARAVSGDHDQHRLGPLIYYRFNAGGSFKGGDDEGVEVSIGLGMLFGLNEHTPDSTLKWSVEVEF